MVNNNSLKQSVTATRPTSHKQAKTAEVEKVLLPRSTLTL